VTAAVATLISAFLLLTFFDFKFYTLKVEGRRKGIAGSKISSGRVWND
jgi:hypothetical protein